MKDAVARINVAGLLLKGKVVEIVEMTGNKNFKTSKG